MRPVFFVLLAGLCLATVAIGAAPSLIYGHDDFLELENGWRVLLGQRPHLDFWSPYGPFTFPIVALD